MPSTTRGSILISTANDIGEALVEKLGGVGYSPNEWKEKCNLCGIAPVDSAPALSVLEDSSETGTARGSILLSTANKIGAVLNKKYNTDRGFKPKEWASAASKLAPLPEKSAESASICSIEDGADDVPIRSLVVTIPPTLTGETQIIEKRLGRNLFNKNAVENNTWIVVNGTTTEPAVGYRTSGYIPVKANTRYYVSAKGSNRSAYYDKNKNGIAYFTFSGGAAFTCLYDGYIRVTIKDDIDLDTFIVNEGNTAITYEPYNETTYTADLSRTIHGGTADIINGVGSDGYKYRLLNDPDKWKIHTGSTLDFYYDESFDDRKLFADSYKGVICSAFPVVRVTNTTYARWNGAAGYYFGIRSEDGSYTLSDIQQMASAGQIAIVYELATKIDFTFDGQEIPTKDGYNAFWSDQGNTALDYYGEPEPYTRGTASGAIANVQSARTDLPFTMVKANIAPNLTGVESVEVTKAGKNLFNLIPYLATDQNTPAFSDCMFIKGGTYTFSFDKISDGITEATSWRYCITIYDKNGQLITDWTLSSALPYRSSLYSYVNGANTTNKYISFNLQGDCYIFIRFWSGNTTADMSMLSAMLEVGSSGTEYTPYEEPTVYTADLGEPVYGGSVDLVSGEVEPSNLFATTRDYNGYSITTNGVTMSVESDGKIKFNGTTTSATDFSLYNANSPGVAMLTIPKGTYTISNIGSNDVKMIVSGGGRNGFPYREITNGSYTGTVTDDTQPFNYFVFRFASGVTLDNVVVSVQIEKGSTAGDYSPYFEPLVIPGKVISPIDGVNNLWNNAGGDTDVEYFTQE